MARALSVHTEGATACARCAIAPRRSNPAKPPPSQPLALLAAAIYSSVAYWQPWMEENVKVGSRAGEGALPGLAAGTVRYPHSQASKRVRMWASSRRRVCRAAHPHPSSLCLAPQRLVASGGYPQAYQAQAFVASTLRALELPQEPCAGGPGGCALAGRSDGLPALQRHFDCRQHAGGAVHPPAAQLPARRAQPRTAGGSASAPVPAHHSMQPVPLNRWPSGETPSACRANRLAAQSEGTRAAAACGRQVVQQAAGCNPGCRVDGACLRAHAAQRARCLRCASRFALLRPAPPCRQRNKLYLVQPPYKRLVVGTQDRALGASFMMLIFEAAGAPGTFYISTATRNTCAGVNKPARNTLPTFDPPSFLTTPTACGDRTLRFGSKTAAPKWNVTSLGAGLYTISVSGRGLCTISAHHRNAHEPARLRAGALPAVARCCLPVRMVLQRELFPAPPVPLCCADAWHWRLPKVRGHAQDGQPVPGDGAAGGIGQRAGVCRQLLL